MSPTLLELIVAALLVWVAWQIGVLLAPRVVAAFLAFWRNSRPPTPTDGWRSEKNVTPPGTPGQAPPPTHGHSDR